MLCSFIRRTANGQIAVFMLGVVVGLLAREVATPTRGDGGTKTNVDQSAARPRDGVAPGP